MDDIKRTLRAEAKERGRWYIDTMSLGIAVKTVHSDGTVENKQTWLTIIIDDETGKIVDTSLSTAEPTKAIMHEFVLPAFLASPHKNLDLRHLDMSLLDNGGKGRVERVFRMIHDISLTTDIDEQELNLLIRNFVQEYNKRSD